MSAPHLVISMSNVSITNQIRYVGNNVKSKTIIDANHHEVEILLDRYVRNLKTNAWKKIDGLQYGSSGGKAPRKGALDFYTEDRKGEIYYSIRSVKPSRSGSVAVRF